MRDITVHLPAVVLTLFIGVVTVIPGLIAERDMGAHYQGVRLVHGSDDLYYLARHKDALDGHHTLANPYLYEHKDGLPAPMWVPDALLSRLGSMLGLGVGDAEVFFDMVVPSTLTALTYGILFFLTRAPLISVAGAMFLHVGLFLDTFNRSPSPQFNFLFVLLLFLFTFLYVRTRKVFFAVLLALTVGALFYIYTYYWTYAAILFALFAFFLLLTKQFDATLRKHTLLMAPIVGIFALPYMLELISNIRVPEYAETLARLGMIETHTPSGFVIVVLSGTAFSALLLAWWRGWIGAGPTTLFLASSVAAAAIATNQHIITGKNLEFSSHYFDIAVFTAVFAFAHVVASLLATSSRRSSEGGAIILVLAAFFSAPHLQETITRQAVASDEEYALQRYAPALGWLQDNAESEEVVLTHQELSALIPIYTSNNVFYARQANFHFMSDEEVRTRFIINNFSATFDEDFIREHEREIFGVHYINRFAHAENENRLRKLLGLSPRELERLPHVVTDEVIAHAEELQQEGFETAVKDHRVDYIITDRGVAGVRPDASWELIATLGDFSIYR